MFTYFVTEKMLFRLAVLVFATATVISEEEEGSQENGIALLFDSGNASICDLLYTVFSLKNNLL